MKYKQKNGFTLIEILLTVTIVGLLAVLAIFGLRLARNRALDSRAKIRLAEIKRALESYASENDEKYPISNSDSSCSMLIGDIETLSTNSCTGKTLASGYLSGFNNDVSGIKYFYDGSEYLLQVSVASNPGYVYQVTASRSSTKKAGSVGTIVDDGNSYAPGTIGGENQKVLIIVNKNSPESIEVGRYYQNKRKIPIYHLIEVEVPMDETISYSDYVNKIRDPIRDFINNNNLRSKIKYIVPTYGIPYKINDTAKSYANPFGPIFSLDGYLSDLNDMSGEASTHVVNPYTRVSNDETPVNGKHLSGIHFETSKNMYLVTRLDGPTSKVAKGLIDKAIYAEKYLRSSSGKGYMAGQPYLMTNGYNDAARTLQCSPLIAAGYQCIKDGSHYGGPNPLWHVSNGNNYSHLNDVWRPGAFPMHFQSFSAMRTIRDTNDSLFTPNAIAADATATWGTVAEPYASYIPQPVAVLDYFLNGNSPQNFPHFNLAESIYMSSTRLKWRWVAIGDPLYILPTTPVSDTESPAITNLTHSNSGSNLTINWKNHTSTNDSPEVTYGEIEYSTNYNFTDSQVVKDESPVTACSVHGYDCRNGTELKITKSNYLAEHSITIPNLTQGVTYYFKVKATDPAGNISTSVFSKIM